LNATDEVLFDLKRVLGKRRNSRTALMRFGAREPIFSMMHIWRL